MKPGTGGEMKQKTALQELRESYLAKYNEAMKLLRDNPNNGSQLDQRREERLRTKAGEYQAMVADIDKLLPTERQQAKDAWVESADKISREMFNEPMMYHEQMECNDYFENYFNETYETP